MATAQLVPEAAERTWWKEHPEPQASVTEGRLVLWNYPVGKPDLAEGHEKALLAFLKKLPLTLGVETGRSTGVVSIIGHASNTGEASMNEQFASERADVVAAYLRGLGFKDENLEVSSVGSSQPWFPSLTPGALAHNRRVELTQYVPTIEPPPPERVDPSKPTGKPPQRPPEPARGGTYYFESQFDFELGEVEDGTLSAEFSIVGKLKGKVSGSPDPQAAAGLVLSGGSLTAEFKAKLREKLDAKLGLEPGKTGERPVLKASVEGEVWDLPVEIGLEIPKQQFLFIEITLGTKTLPEIEIKGATVEVEIEGTVKVAIGPSKALLARFAAEAVAGGVVTTGLVAGGVLTVTAVIIGGTIYAAERGKQQMAELVVEMAVRDGAASRVAFEALGATNDVLVMHNQHRLDLTNVGGEQSGDGFERGGKLVADYLKTLDDKGDATLKAWAEKYGKGKNAQDFDKLREQLLYERFDAYKNDRKPIEQAIAEL